MQLGKAGNLGVHLLLCHGDLFGFGNGAHCQHCPQLALGFLAVALPHLLRGQPGALTVELHGHLALAQPLAQLGHLVFGVLRQQLCGQFHGQVRACHIQQRRPGNAVGVGFVGKAFFLSQTLPQGFQVRKAQRLGKGIVHRGHLLALYRVQADLKLRRLAGKLRHPEVGGVGEVEAESLARAVAVHRFFGGGHQLPGAQHYGHIFHPAVRDGCPLQKALEIQRDPHSAGGGVAGGHKGRMDTRHVGDIRVHGLFRYRAHPAGESKPLVLP